MKEVEAYGPERSTDAMSPSRRCAPSTRPSVISAALSDRARIKRCPRVLGWIVDVVPLL
jgi:hypothetical protein